MRSAISSDPTAENRCGITSGTWDIRERGEAVAPPLNSDLVTSFLELHIEQGPLLEADGIPVGIATAVRGNVRFPDARCIGAYGHSAALPRRFRQDAVLAVAELALGLDQFWKEQDRARRRGLRLHRRQILHRCSPPRQDQGAPR